MRRALPAAATAVLLTLGAVSASAQTDLPAPKPWAEPTKDPRDLNGVYMPESNSFSYLPVEGGKKLEDLVTFDDPKVYTKTWTARLLYDWRPDIRFIEYICEENNRNPVSADGAVGVAIK
jgi:hypothetical protein